MKLILEPTIGKVKHSASPKRERYWTKVGGKPTAKRACLPNMQRRLMQRTILTEVAELGKMSDAAVITTARREDLVRNLTFAIHQQRLSGALSRLRKHNPFTLVIPPKVESARLASAFKSQEEKRG